MKILNLVTNVINTILGEISKVVLGFIAGFTTCILANAMFRKEFGKKNSFDGIIDSVKDAM